MSNGTGNGFRVSKRQAVGAGSIGGVITVLVAIMGIWPDLQPVLAFQLKAFDQQNVLRFDAIDKSFDQLRLGDWLSERAAVDREKRALMRSVTMIESRGDAVPEIYLNDLVNAEVELERLDFCIGMLREEGEIGLGCLPEQ